MTSLKYKKNIGNIDNHEEDEKENIKTQQQINIMRVNVSSLAGKFRAKSDICTYLSQKLQMFLPPIEEVKISIKIIISMISWLLYRLSSRFAYEFSICLAVENAVYFYSESLFLISILVRRSSQGWPSVSRLSFWAYLLPWKLLGELKSSSRCQYWMLDVCPLHHYLTPSFHQNLK